MRLRRFMRGQASLEMLIVLLMLVPLILGGIELSRGVAMRSAMDSGVALAVRKLSLDPGAWDVALGFIGQAMDDNVMGSTGAPSVTVTDVNGHSLTREAMRLLPFSSTFCVRASITFTPQIPLLPLGGVPISVRHCGLVERMN